MAAQYIPPRPQMLFLGSPDSILLARMQSLSKLLLSCLLLTFCVGAKADIYNEVNRLVLSGQWSVAQSQAEKHLKVQPTDPQMRLLLSRIQDGQGQTAVAIETLQNLTQSFPELPEPHNNLASLLARENRYAEALESLQAAVRARPDYATALENLGDLYIALAIESYRNASIASPSQNRTVTKRSAAEQILKSSQP